MRAVLLGAAGFASSIVTMLTVSGQWPIPDETVRYGMTMGMIVMALSFFVAAIYVWPRR